jgi:hypothetical protein
MAWLSVFEPVVCDWCKEKIDRDEPVVELIDGWLCDFCSMSCYNFFVEVRNKRIEALGLS